MIDYRLIKASIDCESVQTQQSDLESLSSKVVDFRREKAVLRDLHYLSGMVDWNGNWNTREINKGKLLRGKNNAVNIKRPIYGDYFYNTKE